MNENIPKKTIIGYSSLMNTMVTSIRIDNAWSFMLVLISWKCNVFNRFLNRLLPVKRHGDHPMNN